MLGTRMSAPVVGGDLTWARARLESPYGPIDSEWRIAGDERFELQVSVPAGTAADVRLPDGAESKPQSPADGSSIAIS
jgi:alpha-L-rhamnosidase